MQISKKDIYDNPIQEIIGAALEESLTGSLFQKEFRHTFKDSLAYLDFIEDKKLLILDYSNPKGKTYSLSVLCLEIANTETSKVLKKDIDQILKYFQDEYYSSQSDEVVIKLNTISSALEFERPYLEVCVRYILEVIPIGKSLSLSDDDSTLTLGAGIESPDGFINILKQRLEEKFPNSQVAGKRTHGNSEVSALKREEILGAALAVLAKYPEQCVSDAGKVKATKIAKLIDQKSQLLFKTGDGDPPMAPNTIARLVGSWLKILD